VKVEIIRSLCKSRDARSIQAKVYETVTADVHGVYLLICEMFATDLYMQN
jgi:hypothetical protein